MTTDRTLYHSHIKPVDPPRQTETSSLGLGLEMLEVDVLVQAAEARSRFQVDGSGTTVAVLDTGCRNTHVDFAGRIVEQRNFTADNGNNPADASDGQGHGTNVTGIIAANARHKGVAPGASVVPVKVLNNSGGGTFAAVADALKWIVDNHVRLNITACCMSLGNSGNYQADTIFPGDEVQALIRDLRHRRVAVVVAAGNDYKTHNSRQGMAYPAIFRETISVGAVYDAKEGSFSYNSGASAFSTTEDQITPFSQRLHPSVAPDAHTDIFAPGAPVTSSGILSDEGESTQHGTSQAAPVTTGVILLLQDFYRKLTGQWPEIDDLAHWLQSGGVAIHDGDDEDDNVGHTNQSFYRVNAIGALLAVRRHMQLVSLNSMKVEA